MVHVEQPSEPLGIDSGDVFTDDEDGGSVVAPSDVIFY